jgi:alkylation response protein AidB-like acyl-CoA dehydrogenase
MSIATRAHGLEEVTRFADEVRDTVHERDAIGTYPADLVPRMAALGLFGRCAGDLRTYALAMEEVGRAWLSLVPIVNAHSTSVWVIEHYGTTAQQDMWLGPFRGGDALACLALTEPHGGSDLASVRSSATRDGSGWRLNGHKTYITHADHAQHMLVLARTDIEESRSTRTLGLFLIDRDQYTVVRKLPKLGTISVETCEVTMNDVRLEGDRLIGEVPGRGFPQVMDALEVGRIAVAAAAVGVARSALWRAIERVRERHAFGAPLADNSFVRQRIATMTTQIAAAKGLVQIAASAKNDGGRHDVETSSAKVAAADAAVAASLMAMELGGGAGYTEDLDFARHLRDATLFLAGEGPNTLLDSLIGARMVEATPDLAWI